MDAVPSSQCLFQWQDFGELIPEPQLMLTKLGSSCSLCSARLYLGFSLNGRLCLSAVWSAIWRSDRELSGAQEHPKFDNCMKQELSQPSIWPREKPGLCSSLKHFSFPCNTRRQGKRSSSPHLTALCTPRIISSEDLSSLWGAVCCSTISSALPITPVWHLW